MKWHSIRSLWMTVLTVSILQGSFAYGVIGGVKTSGMAQTSVAYPIDAFAGAYNPAAITLLCDRLDVGITWQQYYQRANFRDFPDYNDQIFANIGVDPVVFNDLSLDGSTSSDIYLPEVGINKRFCFSGCSFPFEVSGGFVLYNRYDIKANYDQPLAFFGTTDTKFEYLHEVASFLLAAKFCKMHSLGISLDYNLQRLKVNGLELFSSDTANVGEVYSAHPDYVTNKGYNYSNGWGVTLGYLFEWRCFKAGAAWHPKTSMQDFNKYRGLVANEGDFDIPQRFTMGISYRFLPCMAVAFDYEHICWREVPFFRNSVFPNLNNEKDKYRFGAGRGAGFNYRNQSIYRFGAEYMMNRCLTLRLGFRYNDNPINRDANYLNLLTLDCMEHLVTFGATYRLNRCHELSFFYGLGMSKFQRGKDSVAREFPYPNTNGDRSSPLNAVPSGNTLTEETGNGEVDIRQRKMSLGISWGWYF